MVIGKQDEAATFSCRLWRAGANQIAIVIGRASWRYAEDRRLRARLKQLEHAKKRCC